MKVYPSLPLCDFKKDAERYAKLHRWHQHLSLEGVPFYVVFDTSQQKKYTDDPAYDAEKRQIYAHFFSQRLLREEQVKKLDAAEIPTVKLNCFFGSDLES